MVITSGDRRLSPATAVILVSLVGIQGIVPVGADHVRRASALGAYAAHPLDDQVLAGVLMCIPASFVYVGSTCGAVANVRQ